MPVEFISATHITPVASAHGHNLAGFDPDYTKKFACPPNHVAIWPGLAT